MTPGLRRELSLLVLWVCILFLVGSLFGHAVAFVFSGLFLYVLWNIYNLRRLTRWLSHPSKNTPETAGVWDEIFYQLYHLYQRQRKARRKLTSILARFQKSTQALPYATIVFNENEEIEWFNAAASKMFSLRSGLDVGQRIDNLIRQPKFARYIAKKKYEKPLEFVLDQQTLMLSITSYGSGQFLLSARDVTQRKQLDDTRRDFIANASHELRTPITVISGYVETLLVNADGKNKEPLVKIQQQTRRMENILREMIELAKLETGDVDEHWQQVDVENLLKEIFKESKAIDRDEHQLELDVRPVTIRGNCEELRIAFSNLLTNAIRYTPKGNSIKLSCSMGEKEACVAVQDQGIGISYEHIPRLTERFYRVDPGRSREQGGTGLGLAIVKHIVDRHDGVLHIQSRPGEGSLFKCCFMQQPADYIDEAVEGLGNIPE